MAPTQKPAASDGEKKTPAKKDAPAAAKEPKLFVAKTAAMGAVNVRPGEVAIEGAQILRTHPHLFKPLEITHRA